MNELEQIRFALDQAAIVAITDVFGRIKYVNDTFCQISKYSRGELIGQDHRILNSGYHAKAFIRELWLTIARGALWRGEIRNQAKDGTIYWVDTTIVPFLNEDGKPWQYMAIRYDVTERKRQEQKLLDQASLASLGEMAAVVAHEVRNPLAGIRGGLQLLETMLRDSREGHESVREMVARIDSLDAVIEDLLTFARIRELRMAPVEISVLLSDIVQGTSYDPSFRDVRWVVDIQPDVVVYGDPNHLRSLITNLLMNAAQSMPQGGTVDVQGRLSQSAWLMTIRDHGVGIPPELRGRVFEPFYTTKARGTGLGLPTARRIAEAHGGAVALDDAPGGGTLVSITLSRPPA